MDYTHFKNFERIAVTGPQRSGTTITAKIIAMEIGYRYVDENEFGINGFNVFWGLFISQKNIVVQCPALCHKAVDIGKADSTAVVMVRRDVDDIIESQERIGWAAEGIEQLKYKTAEKPIAKVKYDFWDQHQKWLIPYPFEINYDDLEGHSLWVTKANRRRFKVRQTEL